MTPRAGRWYIATVIIAAVTGVMTVVFAKRPELSELLGIAFLVSAGAALLLDYRRLRWSERS